MTSIHGAMIGFGSLCLVAGLTTCSGDVSKEVAVPPIADWIESAHQRCEWICSGEVDYIRLDIGNEIYECACVPPPPGADR